MTARLYDSWAESVEAEAVAALAARSKDPCPSCGGPLGWEPHTPHPDDRTCGIDNTGCTCPQLCAECCPCTPGGTP